MTMRKRTRQDSMTGDFNIYHKGYVISLALGGYNSIVFLGESDALFTSESTDGQAISECLSFIDNLV